MPGILLKITDGQMQIGTTLYPPGSLFPSRSGTDRIMINSTDDGRPILGQNILATDFWDGAANYTDQDAVITYISDWNVVAGGGGGTVDSTIINGSNNAVSGNAVYDRFALEPKIFNVKSYGAVGDGSTNDTAAIQSAINAAVAAYGGEVFFPTGRYIVSGALVTSVDTINPNCQIYMPLVDVTGDMVSIKLRGEYPPNFFSEGIAGIPRNTRGTIIESTITGTGSFPSVIGTSYPTTGTGLNYMKVEMENLIVRTSTISGGTDIAGTMCGVNMNKMSAFNVHNVKVDISSVLANSVEPTHETYGMLFPAVNNKAECFVTGDLQVEGYKYGVVIAEHLQADRIATYGNAYGLLIPDGYHDFNITHFTAEVNKYSILANGTMEGVIGLYDAEHYILNDKWYKNLKDFVQVSGSSKVTILKANVVESGFGRNSYALKSDPTFFYTIFSGHGANAGGDRPGTEYLLSDDFHRADNASAIGTSNVAWVVQNGTWGITGNKAYAASEVSTGATTFENIHADAGVSNFTYSVDMKVTGSGTGAVLFRYVDGSNYWYLEMSGGNLSLYKRVAGTFNLVSTVACTNTYANIKVNTSGSGINVVRNGISIITVDDAAFQTATVVGLCVVSGSGLGGGVRFSKISLHQ